jgi:zona occludens toxin
MATSIHHGPPGSFKSFTLVQRSVIDALKAGRVVITNIRGLTSIDRIRDQFDTDDFKIPDSADLIFVNTEVEQGRLLMAGWFHWVPLRALVIIDEGQRIYPDRRDFKLESLDQKIVPTGFAVDEIEIEINDEYTGQRYIVRRPEDVFTAFDMQRHFQWDVFVSTPNIAKIKSPIREVAETAYRHKSLSGKLPASLSKLFGFHNAWYEFQHDPENSGKLSSQIIGKPRKYRADERIFRCYQSTATGEHTESKADQTIIGDPKFRILAIALVLALGTIIFNLAGRFSSGKSAPTSNPAFMPGPAPSHPPVSGGSAVADRGHNTNNVSARQAGGFFDVLGYRLMQVAYQRLDDPDNRRLAFVAESIDGLKVVLYADLFSVGVRVSIHGLCRIALIAPDGSMLSLSCQSAGVGRCDASVDAPDLVIRRDCHKYGEPKPVKEPLIPQNALVATASSIMPDIKK